jgi:hypothetical protein
MLHPTNIAKPATIKILDFMWFHSRKEFTGRSEKIRK